MATKNENIALLPYRDRVKFIRERLSSLAYSRLKTKDLPKSAKLIAAEKLVEDYAARNSAYHREQLDEVNRRRGEIQDAIILGDTAKALELLKKLEAEKRS